MFLLLVVMAVVVATGAGTVCTVFTIVTPVVLISTSLYGERNADEVFIMFPVKNY